MKKIIIAGAIAAVGAGAFVYTQQSSPAYNVLDYVPADTPLFAAYLEPFPIKHYLESGPQLDQQELANLDDAVEPGEKFLLSLINTYQVSLKDANLFIKTFGLNDNLRSYFYTLGLSPVYKIEIANEQAIWDLLDKAEQESGFSHQKGTLENTTYRAYAIDSKEDVNAEVIVAIDQGLLTVTLNSRYHTPKLLSQALGLSKPEKAINASDIIEKTISKHNFTSASLSFINHVELIKGLTTTNGNQLAQQITTLEEKLGNNSTLAEMRSEQCASELATIATNWPRTVMGYTQLDIASGESSIAFAVVVESNNQVMLKALSEIRGYIPNYAKEMDSSAFSLAVGFDVSKLASTLNSVWSDLQTPSYRCQPLADIQTELAASDNAIAMAGMGANMANGVQGMSLGILDYAYSSNNGETQVDSLNALLTLSAEDPQQLFNTVKMFRPELQQLQLSSDSEPISLLKLLPTPVKMNIDPQLAIKGKHIVIYNGEKGAQAANQLATESLSKNGIYNIGVDLKKVLKPMTSASIDNAEMKVPPELLFLTDYDMRMQMSFDVNEHGLLLKSAINRKGTK